MKQRFGAGISLFGAVQIVCAALLTTAPARLPAQDAVTLSTTPPAPAASPNPTPAPGPTAAVAPSAPASASSATPSADLQNLAAQVKAAKEVRFDASVAVLGLAVPFEVRGVAGSGEANIEVFKGGKLAFTYVANHTSADVYAVQAKRYFNSLTFIRQEIGLDSVYAFLYADIAGTNPQLLISSAGELAGQGWTHNESQVNGEVVEQDRGVFTQEDDTKVSVSYTYTQNPLRILSFSVTSSSFTASVTYAKYDLITDPALASPPSLFVFTPPAGAKQYIPPVPQAAQEPQSSALQAGAHAPDFTVYTPSGRKVRLSNYDGKVVVVDLWATWCGPCQMSLPHTDQIAQRYAGRGVVFLPICVWDEEANFTAWLSAHKAMKMHFLFDNCPDSDKSFSSKLYKVDGIPTQFVIGRNRKIVATFVGYDPDADPNEDALAHAIDKALAEQPGK